MRAVVLLCDNAQAVNGKLYMLGAGWSVTGPGPVTMGVGILIFVPWDQGNRRHTFAVRLLTLDGKEAEWPTPAGPGKLAVEGNFESGRPPGLRVGSDLGTVFALNAAVIPLPPGGYELRLWINGETAPDWNAVFDVRPPAPQQPVVYYPEQPPT